MDQQKDDTIRPVGRQDKKRKEERRDTELKIKSKKTKHVYVKLWWAKDDTRDPTEGRNEGPKILFIFSSFFPFLGMFMSDQR